MPTTDPSPGRLSLENAMVVDGCALIRDFGRLMPKERAMRSKRLAIWLGAGAFCWSPFHLLAWRIPPAQTSDRPGQSGRRPKCRPRTAAGRPVRVYRQVQTLPPDAVRECQAWYVQEHRPSGTVITPRMQCWRTRVGSRRHADPHGRAYQPSRPMRLSFATRLRRSPRRHMLPLPTQHSGGVSTARSPHADRGSASRNEERSI